MWYSTVFIDPPNDEYLGPFAFWLMWTMLLRTWVCSGYSVPERCVSFSGTARTQVPGMTYCKLLFTRTITLTHWFIHTYMYSKHTVLVSPLHQVLPVTICSQGLLCSSPLTRWIHSMQTKLAAPRLWIRPASLRCSLRQHWTRVRSGQRHHMAPLPACRRGDALPPLAELGATEEGNLTQDSALSREFSDINGGDGPGDFEVLWELLFSKVLGSPELKVLGCFTSLGRLVSFS